MHCGLFGKLLQKRDFVAVAVPRHFLRLWEPWIENCLSDSRRGLERAAWVAMFTAAPIWRFFLGEGLCGAAVCGAFMPSMDGLGRYFPLTLMAWSEAGAGLSAPAEQPRWAWFESAEELLLSTLRSEVSMEAIEAELTKLATGPEADKIDSATETFFLPPGTLAQPLPLREIFAAPGQNAATSADFARMTFWWTLGGENHPAWAWSRKSMPNSQQFTAMLRGEPSQLPQDLFPAQF